MFKAVLLLVSTAFGLMNPTYSSQIRNDSLTPGEGFTGSLNERIRAQIERNFSLKTKLSHTELLNVITQAVQQANPDHEGLEEAQYEKLPADTLKVASCYGVDPVIFTSLVWRESNFKLSALSERGAAGLTQMTNRGIQEVLERLSPISHRRLGHLRALVKKCNPELLAFVPPVASADTLAAWKNRIYASPRDSLVMGVLLLKINLASVDPLKQKFSQIAAYQVALEKYNGDPKIKVQFARDVLLLSKRMVSLPEVALNDSKFLSQIRGL